MQPSTARIGAARFLNVHEYVGMELMTDYGIAVPKHAVATSAAEARSKATEVFGGACCVVMRGASRRVCYVAGASGQV